MSGKSKVVSTGKLSMIKGGSGHMFGRQHAGTKTPGVTGKSDKNGGGKFAKGGTKHMFGRQHASPRTPGKTGK